MSLERLSFLAHPCYLAWYHTVIAYEKFLASGNPVDNNEFKKMRTMAERFCNDENDNNSPPAGLAHTPSPSENNTIPPAASPTAENYNSSLPVLPLPAPQFPSVETNKMPPLAPPRRGFPLPPVLPDSYNLSARDPQTLSGQQSTSPDGPSIIQGEAGKHFASPSQALKSWATSVWQESKKQAVEFAGKLYQNWDGTWSYSPSYRGTEGNSKPQKADPYVFTHGNPLKSYEIHTHGDYRTKVPYQDGSYSYREFNASERRSVDEFSKDDRLRSDRTGYPQFILTPGGVVKEFIPDPIRRMGFGFLLIEDGGRHFIGNLNNRNAWNEPNNL